MPATTVHISIVTAIGSFATALTAIALGYLLIASGADQEPATMTIKAGSAEINLFSFVPGLLFAFFGCGLAAWTVHRLIGKSK